MRRTRSRFVVPFFLFTLVLGACGGDEEVAPSAAETPEDTVVTSSDGGLRVTVPPGATDRPDEISVEVLNELPKDLGTSKGTAYELTPDGLTFDEPITIERRIDAAVSGVDLSQGLPTIALLSKSDGRWSALEDLGTRVEDGIIVASGTTTHFSTVIAVNSGITVQMTPSEETGPVGHEWEATSEITGEGETDTALIEVEATGTGIVKPLSAKKDDVQEFSVGIGEFKCIRKGEGTFTLTLKVREDLSAAAGFLPGDPNLVIDVATTGTVSCDEEPDEDDGGEDGDGGQATFQGGTIDVEHLEYNGYPSNTVFSMCFPRFDGEVMLQVAGMNDGKPLTAPVEDGRAEVRGGLSSYGPLEIEMVELIGDQTTDVTKPVQDYFGDIEVTSKEGVIAGSNADCP